MGSERKLPRLPGCGFSRGRLGEGLTVRNQRIAPAPVTTRGFVGIAIDYQSIGHRMRQDATQGHPETIEEVRRILREQAGEK